jgi:hypothetical protein
MKDQHRGSCHCGTVRFEVSVDLADETSRCNCSVCTKTRFWKVIAPAADFRLVAGQQALSDYQFGTHSIHHQFCSRCGVKVFGCGEAEQFGGVFYAINVATLDLSPKQFANVPVKFEDGGNDHYERSPEVTSYL